MQTRKSGLRPGVWATHSIERPHGRTTQRIPRLFSKDGRGCGTGSFMLLMNTSGGYR